MKLSLTAKVLILVCVSLCLETAFVAEVTYLQNEAEASAQRAKKAHDISDCINRLTGDLYEAWNVVGSVTNKSQWLSEGFLDRSYKRAMSNLKADDKELDALTVDRPELNSAVKRLYQSVEEAEAIFNRASVDIAEGRFADVLELRAKVYPRLKAMFRGVISQELAIVAKHERNVAEQSIEQQAIIRRQIMQSCLAAFALNVVISVILAAFMVKGITQRLKIMSANTNLFAAGKPLNPPISGGDEIAALDSSFHNMTARLKEAERQRQEFVNMLTHDMRSPLTIVQGCLELLTAAQLGELNRKGETLAPLAYSNCTRIMHLINDLLDVEKIKSGMMSLKSSEFFVIEVFDIVARDIGDWVAENDIKLKVVDSDALVFADKDLVGRVLFNLVSNAVSYSPAGGVITLSAKADDDMIVVSVADQGPGIPAEMRQAVFERFQQSKDELRKGTGSGLGLTICKAILDLHAGKIWVDSEMGKGSTFHFSLPRPRSDRIADAG